MRRMFLAVLVLCLLLLACSTLTPADSSAAPPAVSVSTEASPTFTPGTAPKPALPLTTYKDASVGFEIDYPEGWMLESMVIGPRGSQAQITSWEHTPGDILSGRPDGSTLVSVTAYAWEPGNDLTAYAEHRKTAWEASGTSVLSEESVTLADGRPARLYLLQAPDAQSLLLFAAYGAYYVEVAGDGDLSLVQQLALTLRPLD